MRERTIRLGSFGKTFSVTGWRLGYAAGDARLIQTLKKAHQFIAYTCPSHLQAAVAGALALGDDYYETFAHSLQEKRDLLTAGLTRAGFDVLPVEGAYFVNVDVGSVGRDDDMAFCREIAERAKVAAVPLSAFYHPSIVGAPRRYARFCFAKRREVLEEAATRLQRYFS